MSTKHCQHETAAKFPTKAAAGDFLHGETEGGACFNEGINVSVSAVIGGHIFLVLPNLSHYAHRKYEYI